MAETQNPAELLVVGANHRSSSMALRDKLLIDDAAQRGFFARLKRAGISQAVLVSTCDRVEVVAMHDDPEDAVTRIRQILADHAGVDSDELDTETYAKDGGDAVRHLFAVTASLDSLVLGEPQLLGQIKTSHRQAKDAGMGGVEIDRYLDAAYNAAKRIRHETEIGHRPVSIAAAALQAARDLHGKLENATALLVGTGEMGEVIAAALKSGGLGDLVVTHPSHRRAETLGQRLDCHVAAIDDLPALLAKSDIVLTAMNTRQYVVQHVDVAVALKARRHRPMFLIDTGIPGDIEPAVDGLADAFRYTLDDLERITREGRATREAESEAAWRIIDEESALFQRGRHTRDAGPAIRALRRHFEAAQAQALAESGGDAERATRQLIDRLLDTPSARLRELATQENLEDQRDLASALTALHRLFGIEPEDNSKPDDDT